MGVDRSEQQKQAQAQAQDAKKLRRHFGLLAALGVILVLAGVVGLVYTGLATLTSMFLFGWLLLIGGVVGLVQAVQSRKSNYFWLAVIVAAINIAAGLVVLRRPEASAEALTMFAALFFLIGGVFRLVGAVVVRGTHFALTLLQGAFGILLGVLILWEWPSSSRYVIGVFFSLALLFDGLGLIALGLGARRVLGMVAEEEQPVTGTTEAAGTPGTPGTAPPTADQEQSNN
ncbi:HDED protein [Streptomyces venezuelae]|uniref:HDED protein n=1 Tax=Streptomyces venezuelae TaxID=54571 RepID=A0A5P2CZB7_STRVZ|nr:HdeD family acid-resistance protein [Streptomyces venezuelae]QES47307.1 HDED protein [Streptomyces venezuelae]